MTIIITLLFLAAVPIADARWLRIAQREHYLAGSVTRFAVRWWLVDIRNRVLVAAAVAGVVASLFIGWAAIIPIEAAALGPIGLSMRGRTSKLAWTRRLKTLAVTHAFIIAAIGALGFALGAPIPVLAALAVLLPVTLDLALAATKPLERRAAQVFVDQARERLDRVAPIRVAITGSYGKTTIKGYVRHLTEGTRAVVASPASFNNTGGLSRTVNEHLGPDTEVFIAEMGTYGPGEIRDLCSWVKPDIAALCNIGPVHLERFGTLDRIVESKSEIFETASTCVVNVDAHGLADVARRLRSAGKHVLTASTSPDSDADVVVAPATQSDRTTVRITGVSESVHVATDALDDNVAVAVAIAHALDIPDDAIRSRLTGLPGADHRREQAVSPTGVTIIDDTYNSNPAGAAAALASLAEVEANRRAVVTPGMVELGKQQAAANTDFAAAASDVADHLVIVGATNRDALHEGGARGTATVHYTKTRNEAVEWVRRNLSLGDAVLYENDLPDHYA